MIKLTELLIGRLALDSPKERLAFLVDELNGVIRPPREATAENVNIRAMFVVNDLANSHGGRFRKEDLDEIRKLIRDTPVMIGHNRSDAPLARTFYAELEEKDDITWVKSYFFWPRSSNGQVDELLNKIDSGVLKECSISFVYGFPECSICGEDYRRCEHTGERDDAGKARANFIYRDISQVLETSLVYKGSVKGTYITDKLGHESISISGIQDLKSAAISIIPVGDESEDFDGIGLNRDRCLAIAIRNQKPYLLVKQQESGG